VNSGQRAGLDLGNASPSGAFTDCRGRRAKRARPQRAGDVNLGKVVQQFATGLFPWLGKLCLGRAHIVIRMAA